ncbi:MAG: hypothetical protein NTZ77_02975 [Caldiserica bacterium]|nr:hypothetical protein [Caldisericota bacterium]
MNTNSRIPPDRSPADRRIVLGRPSTWLGWWSIALGVIFVVLVVNKALVMRLTDELSWIDAILPSLGVAMMSCGMPVGLVSLTALTRRHERSLSIWLTPVLVIVWVIVEFFLPH